jgi:ribosomal protein S18 acetylase RimI-like enzyme
MVVSPFAIRSMTVRDHAPVLRLWKSVPGMGLDSLADSKRGIALFLKRNPGFSLVALSDGRVVGAVLCGHDGRKGYLYHVAVAPGWQGKGIGQAMVKQALKALQQSGIGRADVHVFRGNRQGRKFWEKIGWRERTSTSRFVIRTDGKAVV